VANGTSGASVTELGDPSIFTGPECHGTLSKLRGEPVRYRCHAGHAFTADSLLAALSEITEDAVWVPRVNQGENVTLGRDGGRA
jgi:two-component system chemotaxis response regulator CheB